MSAVSTVSRSVERESMTRSKTKAKTKAKAKAKAKVEASTNGWGTHSAIAPNHGTRARPAATAALVCGTYQ